MLASLPSGATRQIAAASGLAAMDYAMPRAGLVSNPKLLEHPVPTQLNPLGAKGVGEAGVTGSLPALMNAVVDALRSAGVRHFELPATPQRIWQALRAARS